MSLRHTVWSLVAASLVFTLVACSSDGASDDSMGAGTGTTMSMAGTEAAADGGVPDGTTEQGDSGVERVPFPEGSRQYGRVFNLVDADAKAQLEDYLMNPAGHDGAEATLELVAQKFYAVYPDDYDFLFVLTDHTLGGDVSAMYSAVRQDTIVGTGIVKEPPRLRYYSEARLKGVIGIDYLVGAYGPLLHELAHRWGNFLDPSLGFGQDGDLPIGPHWGLTGVFGQLGGFDENSIECETPAGAKPPDCMPLPSGRTRYVFSDYGPNTNSFQDNDYSPLELYLMGLIPKEEVPDTFMVLSGGATDISSISTPDGHVIAEADSIGEIKLADIIDLHGERVPATEAEKHFTAAFIVVSDAPLPDEQLADCSRWSETIAGDYMGQPYFKSFPEATGNRATLDTELRARRAVDDPLVVPVITEAKDPGCSLSMQNCNPGFACYDTDMSSCFSVGSAARGEPCLQAFDCNRGMTCANNVCLAYCEPEPGLPVSCSRVCPNDFELLTDAVSGETKGAYCKTS